MMPIIQIRDVVVSCMFWKRDPGVIAIICPVCQYVRSSNFISPLPTQFLINRDPGRLQHIPHNPGMASLPTFTPQIDNHPNAHTCIQV